MCLEFKAFCCSIGAGLLTLVVLIIVMHFVNKYRFNNGICKKCGGKLRHFDTDSGGNDGYYCDKCKRTIWV